MRIFLIPVALLCSVLPTFAQSSKVYTNADLSAKPVTFSRTVTVEEWSGIAARAFRPLPELPAEARAYVLPYSGDRDFLPRLPPSPTSVIDSWWSDPILAYQLQHPIEAAYGYAFPSHGFSQHNALQRVAAPSQPVVTMPATITTQPGGAGRRVR
jgi:hypothetical protein